MCRRERSSQTSAATCKPPGWRGLGERPPYRAISRASENNRVSTPQSADSSLNLPPSTYLAREWDLLESHVVVGLIPGGSSDVALCADLASLAHNHFDRCDLLRRRVTHNGARTGLATMAAEAPNPDFKKKFTDWPLCGIGLRSISQGSTTRHRHDRAQTTRLFPRVRHSGGRRRTIHHVGFERPTMNALTARTRFGRLGTRQDTIAASAFY